MNDRRDNALRLVENKQRVSPPPHDKRTERAVIDLMMMSPDCLVRAFAAGAEERWFYLWPHRVMFRAIQRLAQAQMAVDLITVAEELRTKGELPEIGGENVLFEVPDVHAMASHLSSYCEILQRHANSRAREEAAIEAVRMIQVGQVDEASKLLKKAARPIEPKEAAEAEARPDRPAVSAYRAAPASLPGLTDGEAAALVRTISAVAVMSESPETCTQDQWTSGFVYLVPFMDGEERALALMRQAPETYTDERFAAAWSEALALYQRPRLSGCPALSQKLIEHLRSEGREDIVPISHGYGIHAGAFVKRDMEFRNGEWIENAPKPLTNFVAWVVAQHFHDDGTGAKERVLRIGGRMQWGEPLPEFEIQAEEWTNVSSWLHKFWGHTVVIFNRRSNTQAVLECMALYSMDAPAKHVYTHSGWVKAAGKYVFLSPGGVIGLTESELAAFGRESAVTLPDCYKHYSIAPVTAHEAAKDAYRWLERLARVADLSITAPLISTLFLAPLASMLRLNFIVAFTGPSDSRKSSLVGAGLAAWGRGIDGDTLPLSFLRTKNNIENMAWSAKDLPIVVDNFVPSINQEQVRTLKELAHSIGDNQGRGRMLDGVRSLQAKPCRGLMIITGEENCEQYSGQARMYVVPMNRQSIRLEELAAVQVAAAQGKLEPAMTHYINWLARKLDDPEFITRLKAKWFSAARGDQATSHDHGRLVAQRKWIDIGLELALESHPAGRWADERLTIEAAHRLNIAAGERGYVLRDASIVSRFFSKVKDMIDLGLIHGANAHTKGHPPTVHAGVFGWGTNAVGEGTYRLNEKSDVGLWVDHDPDRPAEAPWFVWLNMRKLLHLMRSDLDDPMTDSERAITAALEGDNALWVSPGERARGNRTQTETLPGGSRQRMLRIKGEYVIKAMGMSEEGKI